MPERIQMEEKFAAEWERRRTQASVLGVRLRPVPREKLLDNAHRGLSGSRESDGFAALEKLGRLDLTLEALAVDKRFTALFSDEEANEALRRLLDAGYRF